jgi:hypothetical protein
MFSWSQRNIHPRMVEVVFTPFQIIYQGAKAKDPERIKAILTEVSIDLFELTENDSVSCRLARENDVDSVNFLRDNFNASLLLIIRSYAESGNKTEALANYALAKINDPDNARLYLIEGFANCGDLFAVYSIFREMEVSLHNNNKAIKTALTSFASNNHITQAQKLFDDVKNTYSEHKEIIADVTKSLIEGLAVSNWEAAFELYQTMDPLYAEIKEQTFQQLVGYYVITHPTTSIYSQIQFLKNKFNKGSEENRIYHIYAINFACIHRYDYLLEIFTIAKWASPEMLSKMITESGLWLPRRGNKQFFKIYLEWVNKSYPDLYVLVVNHLLVGCLNSVHQLDFDYLISVIKSQRTEDVKLILCQMLENSEKLGNENSTKLIYDKIVKDYPEAKFSAVSALAKGYVDVGNYDKAYSTLLEVRSNFSPAEFFSVLNIIVCGFAKLWINPGIWPLLKEVKYVFTSKEYVKEKVKVLQDVTFVYLDTLQYDFIISAIDLMQELYPQYRLETMRLIADKMVKQSQWDGIKILLGKISKDREDYLDVFCQCPKTIEDAKKLLKIVIDDTQDNSEITYLITKYLSQLETSANMEEWLQYVKEFYPAEVQKVFEAMVLGYTCCGKDLAANHIMDRVKEISVAVASNDGISIRDGLDDALYALDKPDFNEMIRSMICMKVLGFSWRGDFNKAIKLLEIIKQCFPVVFIDTINGALKYAISANRGNAITPLFNYVIENNPTYLQTFICNMACYEKKRGNYIDAKIVLKGLSSIKSNISRLNAANEMKNQKTTNFDVIKLKNLSLKYSHLMRVRQLSFDESLCWITPQVRTWLLQCHKLATQISPAIFALIATYLINVQENNITSVSQKLRTNYDKERFFPAAKRFLFPQEEIPSRVLRKHKTADEEQVLVKRHRC